MNRKQKFIIVFSVIALIILSLAFYPFLVSQVNTIRGRILLDAVLNSYLADRPVSFLCSIPFTINESQQKELDAAQTFFEKAIKFRSSNSQVLLLLGQANCINERPDQAIIYLRQYHLLRPKSPLGYMEIGFAYEKMGDMTSALKYWTEDDQIAQHFLESGEEARRLEDYPQALKWYRRAILAKPGWNEPWFHTFQVYEKTEKFAEGLNSLLEAVNQSKDQAGLSNLLYEIGWVMQYHQKPPDLIGAWNAYSKALDTGDFSLNLAQKAAAFSNRGFILSQQGKMDAAIEQFEIALQINPTSYWPYLGLARAHWQKGDKDAAVEFARQAIPLSLTPSDAYITLGDFYRAEGNTLQAQDMYRQALTITPDNETVQKALEELETTQ